MRARVAIERGGWLEVPRIDAPAERQRWLEAAMGAFDAGYGDRLVEASRLPLRELLATLVEARDEHDLLELAFFPMPGPVSAQVSISVYDAAPPLDAWRDAGWELGAVSTPSLGHGMHAVRKENVAMASETVVTVESRFVFRRGDTSIVIVTTATPFAVYQQMLPGIVDIVGSAVVEFGDGSTFEGAPVPGLAAGDADTWQIGVHDVAS